MQQMRSDVNTPAWELLYNITYMTTMTGTKACLSAHGLVALYHTAMLAHSLAFLATSYYSRFPLRPAFPFPREYCAFPTASHPAKLRTLFISTGGFAPTISSTFFPSSKKMNVGIARIPSSWPRSGSWSTSNLTKWTLSLTSTWSDSLLFPPPQARQSVTHI